MLSVFAEAPNDIGCDDLAECRAPTAHVLHRSHVLRRRKLRRSNGFWRPHDLRLRRPHGLWSSDIASLWAVATPWVLMATWGAANSGVAAALWVASARCGRHSDCAQCWAKGLAQNMSRGQVATIGENEKSVWIDWVIAGLHGSRVVCCLFGWWAHVWLRDCGNV